MDRGHADQVAAEDVDTMIDGDPEHRVAIKIAIVFGDQRGDAAGAPRGH